MKKLFTLVAATAFSMSVFAQKVLVSDPAHSRIQFTVTHLGISDITGSFDKASLSINADEKNFTASKLNFDANINSINTHIEARDNHLKSADFFDAEKYPTLNFVSSSLKKKGKNEYTLVGNLTLHGVTKPVVVRLIYKGSVINPMSKKETYAYQVLGSIKRSEFAVGNNFPEAVISDVVHIKGDFELTEKK